MVILALLFLAGLKKRSLLSLKRVCGQVVRQGEMGEAGVNPKAKETLPLIRKAILNGQSQLADSLVSDNFFGSSELFGNFTSVGNLTIKFLNHETRPDNYQRILDLANSLGLIQYDMNKTAFKREYFCSYPDRVLAMRFSASKPGKISFDLSMDIFQDSSIVEISGNYYRVKGFINENHRPFNVLIYVRNKGGIVGQDGGFLTVRGSDSVEIYLTVATDYEMKYPDYTGADPEKLTGEIIGNVVNK